MRVKDFVKMYRGMRCVEVGIYDSVTEEVLGFEIESGKLKLFIRGCE